MAEILKCECGAAAKDTSKERGRFRRRHPAPCPTMERRRRQEKFTKDLAASVDAVMDDDTPNTPELRVRS
jgi:hypothetical protein